MVRLGGVALSLVLVCACSDEEGNYLVSALVEPGGAVKIEVSVVHSCSEISTLGERPRATLRRLELDPTPDAVPLGPLAAGQYGLYGRAWRSDCELHAAGCDSVTIEPGGTGLFRVTLEAVAPQGCGPGEMCQDGSCRVVDSGDPVPDAGPDAGSDGGPADAGTDAAPCMDVLPSVVGRFDSIGVCRDVAVAGSFAYVADEGHGLQIIDILSRLAPAEEGSVNVGSVAVGVALAGDLAYLATSWGLAIVDVNDTTAPRLIGNLHVPGIPSHVALVGQHALVAARHTGLQIVDVSNPASPVLVSTLGADDDVYDVVVVGELAYLAIDDAGLAVVDVGDPTNPIIAGAHATGGQARGVAAQGQTVAVATTQGLAVFDAEDPLGLVDAGQLPLGSSQQVALGGDHAYVTIGVGGLRVVDLSQPGQPVLMASLDGDIFFAEGLSLDGEVALVTDSFRGLLVIDLGCYTP